jgi:hypothetical protein
VSKTSKILAIAIALTLTALVLLGASRWWEKGLATLSGPPSFSPNECYKVQRFIPFWILPNIFHPRAHPDEPDTPQWFPSWNSPGFYRLYDNRNGELLGESGIFDLADASGPLFWGNNWIKGVSAGLITIGPNAPDCLGERPKESQTKK